jgi:hypothetical protein
MAIMYDRNDTQPMVLDGAGAIVVHGSVYAKSSALGITASGSGNLFDARLVVKSLAVSGNVHPNVSFNQSDNYIPTGGVKLSQ